MFLSPKFVSWVVPPLYKLWCKTLRYTEVGREAFEQVAKDNPIVVCLWHGELFPLLYTRRTLNMGVIVSQSKDGEYITQVLQACGFKTPRGSSSRGGATALLQAVKLMRDEKTSICVTVDGPRGPRHKVKDGAIFLAKQAEAFIVPVRVHMERAKIFHRSWDKFQLPLPFSRLTIYYGEAYSLADNVLEGENIKSACATLGERLSTI